MLASRIVPPRGNIRKAATDNTAIGIEVATVNPDFNPRYAFAAPNRMPNTTPHATALIVNSAMRAGRGVASLMSAAECSGDAREHYLAEGFLDNPTHSARSALPRASSCATGRRAAPSRTNFRKEEGEEEKQERKSSARFDDRHSVQFMCVAPIPWARTHTLSPLLFPPPLFKLRVRVGGSAPTRTRSRPRAARPRAAPISARF